MATTTTTHEPVVVASAPSAPIVKAAPPNEPPVAKAPGRHGPPPQVRIVLPLVLLGALAWWGYSTWLAAQPPGPMIASGTVEAEEVLIGFELGGRLMALPVKEGQTVGQGDVLAQLDDSLVQLQMRQADSATRQQLEINAQKYTLRAPVGGVVTRVPVKMGEVISPGQTVAAVADLSNLTLTAYVLERDLGRVQVGQAVSVTADPFPGRSFEGVVTSLNSRAEFTPRNVQTQRDRLNLVFGVNLRVANPDRLLKPGMPVDVAFGR